VRRLVIVVNTLVPVPRVLSESSRVSSGGEVRFSTLSPGV
jgi:hypothetical protein